MSLTKIITDTIDLNLDTTGLKMPKGTTAQRPATSLIVDYLVVGGGGGGGGWSTAGSSSAGGGGAGGLRTSYGSTSGGGSSAEASLNLSINTAYTVIIGAGGAGANNGVGSNGNDSKFGVVGAEIISDGGGGGGGFYTIGGTGGSGGGAGDNSGAGSGTLNQGFAGGAGTATAPRGGGGGGGAASAGGNVSGGASVGGNSGDGLNISITGTSVGYAGGGGGGSENSTVISNSFGGGSGGASGSNTAATDGTANTGGGGGGGTSGSNTSPDGASGGSGVVIIRTPSYFTATFTAGVTANGNSGSSITPTVVDNDHVWIVTATSNASQTVTFSGTPPTIGETRENTTTSKMEIYTGAKGWRALQQTGQDVGVVPSNNFNTVLYTGTSSTPTVVTGVGFKPDFTWLKARNNSWPHGLFSTIMPIYATTGGYEFMYSNTTSTSTASWGSLRFDSDGWSGLGGSHNGTFAHDFGASPYNYISWNWKAGGEPTVSNPFMIDGVSYATASAAGMDGGSVSPTKCSVNTETGFSMVANTSPVGAYTCSHGLTKAPEFWTHKSTTYSYGWETQFPLEFGQASGSTSLSDWYKIILDTNAAAFTPNPNYYATNTIFSSTGWGQVDNFVTYFWHSVPGYSLINSYTGTGNATNTPIIYTGFEPAWIMVKRIDSTGAWNITDNKRNTSNPRNTILEADASNTEYTNTNYNINFYNDGFQINNNTSDWNAAGGKYLFMCFAS